MSTSSANASIFDEYVERSKVNKELNDKKRLATTGANFAHTYTVQFGTCKFPENFTGCQDLAKQKITFKEPEAAKKACEDPTPVINGRRANCNLASLGARRPRSSANTSPRGCNVGPRSTVLGTAASNQVQWYYPTGTPAAPFHHQPQAIPFHAYGYSPTYIATDMGYNPNMSYGTGGSYINGGHYSQVYPGPAQGMMPVYPVYHFNRPQTMGVAAAPHMFPYSTAGPVATIPTVISKPPAMAPNTESKKKTSKSRVHLLLGHSDY